MSSKKAKSHKPGKKVASTRSSNSEVMQIIKSWILPITLITAVSFSPMLLNEFTNWDDPYYVVQNPLLRGPDWAGIFSMPVVSNYHPVTILTLALNYAMSQLNPISYLVTNLLLHLFNTGLVFYFIWLISGKKYWVAAFTALIFGVHPMHVESVAWVSERKDVLYTFFFLLSLIKYWKYLSDKKTKTIIYCFLFFALSILSKPAAIILPLVLFLLDYWQGRKLSKGMIVEKIPFLILSIVLALVTLKVQSKTAIVALDLYPVTTRFFFATYTSMMYIIKFIVPYPLSTFHPYPATNNLPLIMYLSPLFIIGLLILLYLKRKNKVVVFSIFFFFINLALVLQIVSIGGTLLSERYTYVPYIGIGFLIGMPLNDLVIKNNQSKIWLIPGIFIFAFAIITFFRTMDWKNSDTLWTNTLKHYPNAPVPRTNRANYLIHISSFPENKNKENELLQRALEDCNVSLRNKPNHAKGYENRENIYLRFRKDSLALADANSLIKLEPTNHLGYFTKATAYQRLGFPDSALKYFDRCLELRSNADFAYNSRGSLLYNTYKRYNDALNDFNKAIQLNPSGDYYLNRSLCFYQLGNLEQARNDATMAVQKGKTIPDNYKKLLNF